jgi:tetratricopeptide (TPR) repeat protein
MNRAAAPGRLVRLGGSGRAAASIAITAALLVSLCPAKDAEAQLQPRIPASAGTDACPAAPAPRATGSSPARLATLIQQAQQSAMVGDRVSARELLSEAVRLAPGDGDAAYLHGRLLEELGDYAAAEHEYCRFLAIDPNGPDASDVRARLAAVQTASATPSTEALEALRSGVAHLAANNLSTAERAFTIAAVHDPALAEAYLNRGIAREARGRARAAILDYREFLEHTGNSPERAQVEQRIRELVSEFESPRSAFLKGALVPGLGQLSTGRLLPGVAVLSGTAGAALLATRSREGTRTVHFTDPFGNEWSYPEQVREYPYRTLGIAAAVAVTLGAAGEAFLHSRSVHSLAELPTRRLAVRPMVVTPERATPGREVGIGLELRARR